MQRRHLLTFIVLFSFFAIPKAKASHCAGGELIYRPLTDSTYLFTFKFYRDCTGAQEPFSATLCAINPCKGTTSNHTLTKITTLPDGRANGSQVANGCPGFKNKCEDISSAIPGYREWWYTGTVKITDSCTNWSFSVSVNARNPSNNINGGDLVVIAELDNKNAPGNTSPYFTVKPVPFVCINSPYKFNNGVVDPDGDSLDFQLQIPIVRTQCSPPRSNISASLATKAPPLGLPGNPFQTNNSFQLNQNNGNLSFTPTELGPQTVSFIAREYRNGKLIGSVVRDVQIQVLNCTTPPIDLTLDTASIMNGILNKENIEACYANNLNFCFDIKSTTQGTILTATDNHGISIPGANITYSNTATDSVRACVTWAPTIQDTGLNVLTITVKDSTCKSPGIAVTQTFTIPIKVNAYAPPPVVISPIVYCKDETADPLTATGKNLLWYTASTGGSGSSTPPVPNTNSIGQTIYYVSHIPNGCTSARVPLQVDVTNGPVVNVVAASDTVCQYADLLFYNNATNINAYLRSWDVDSGRIVGGATTDSIIADWTTTGLKTVTLTIGSAACSISRSVDIYVKPSPVAFFEMPNDACVGQEVTLKPYKVDSVYYYWSVDGQTVYDTNYVPQYKFTWNTTGEKRIKLTVTGWNGCTAPPFDTLIDIHSYPDASITGPDFNDICYGSEFELSVQEGHRFKYEWTPALSFISYNKNKAIAKAEKTGYLYSKVSNFWGCASVDSFYIDAGPCCDVLMPDAFTPDQDGINDTYRPLKANNHTIISFTIYNRWGKQVYKSRDISRGWNGYYNGEPQDLGTYYYLLEYLCDGNEEKTKKGNFTLIR